MVVITINDNGKQLEIDTKGSKMTKIEYYFANSISEHINNIKKDIDKIIND